MAVGFSRTMSHGISFVGTKHPLHNKQKREKFEGLHYIMPVFFLPDFRTHFLGNKTSSFIQCQHEIKATE